MLEYKMSNNNSKLEKHVFPVSVDPVIFSIINNELHILLIKRKSETFDGFMSLPGGLMHKDDKSLESAVIRVLELKTGAKVNYVEQLESRTGHDPRGPTISIAYIALVNEQQVQSNSVWIPLHEINDIKLAFDHNEVVAKAVSRLTSKVNYSTIPMHFLPQPFTLPKLQQVYEILLGEKLDKSTFRKKIDETNAVYETGDQVKEGAFRPAKLYRLVKDEVYNFDSNIVRSSQKA